MEGEEGEDGEALLMAAWHLMPITLLRREQQYKWADVENARSQMEARMEGQISAKLRPGAHLQPWKAWETSGRDARAECGRAPRDSSASQGFFSRKRARLGEVDASSMIAGRNSQAMSEESQSRSGAGCRRGVVRRKAFENAV